MKKLFLVFSFGCTILIAHFLKAMNGMTQVSCNKTSMDENKRLGDAHYDSYLSGIEEDIHDQKKLLKDASKSSKAKEKLLELEKEYYDFLRIAGQLAELKK